VFPVLHVLESKYFLILAFVGASAGLFIGLLVSYISKITVRGFVTDALLGLFGAVGALLFCLFAPWPRDTVTYRVNGAVETTTTIGYRHPERIALLVAIALPAVRELYYFLRYRPKPRA